MTLLHDSTRYILNHFAAATAMAISLNLAPVSTLISFNGSHLIIQCCLIRMVMLLIQLQVMHALMQQRRMTPMARVNQRRLQLVADPQMLLLY